MNKDIEPMLVQVAREALATPVGRKVHRLTRAIGKYIPAVQGIIPQAREVAEALEDVVSAARKKDDR